MVADQLWDMNNTASWAGSPGATPTDELDAWEKAVIHSPDHIPLIVAHEFIHLPIFGEQVVRGESGVYVAIVSSAVALTFGILFFFLTRWRFCLK